MAISTGAAILGAGAASLVGGALGARGAKDAARIQAGSAEQALAEQQRQFNVANRQLQPYRALGTSSISRIRDLLFGGGASQALENDPGYQFRFGEGERALHNQLRASGMMQSGAGMKGAMRYGQGFASNELNNIYNRLANSAGMGQGAVNAGVNYGQGYANSVGNLMTGVGNARGAAAISGANSYGNAIGNIGNQYVQQSVLDRLFPQQQSGNPYGFNTNYYATD